LRSVGVIRREWAWLPIAGLGQVSTPAGVRTYPELFLEFG